MFLSAPYLWSVIKVEKIAELRQHAGPVYQLQKGRSNGRILSASGDKFVAEWNYDDLLEKHQLQASNFAVQLESACYSMIFLQEKQLLLAGNAEGGIHVIDLAKNQEVRLLKVHEKGVFCFAYVAEENMVVCGGGDGMISAWDADSWKLLRHFKVSAKKIRSIELIEKHMYVGDGDGYIRVFDLPWLNEVKTVSAHEDGVYCMVKHPSKPVLISGGKDAHIRFWSYPSLEPMHQLPAHNFGVYTLAFSPDKKKVLSTSRDKTVKIWDADTFDLLVRIERPQYQGHTHSVNDACWLSDELFISTGDDRRLICWKISDV